MTKTAYSSQMSDEELAEMTRDLSPEDREHMRVENATSPLFDMLLRFQDAFCDRAIDRLDVTDDDAEAMAKSMKGDNALGNTYAYLLRQIANRRRLRQISHMANAVWAASGDPEGMSIPEICERYAKLPKGAS